MAGVRRQEWPRRSLVMLDPMTSGGGRVGGTPGAGGASTRAHNNNTLLARAAPLGLYLGKISEAALAGK